jgi:hypothetical protein
LHDIELQKCRTKFVKTYSHKGSSDVELDDLFSELKMLQTTLPDEQMFAVKMFELVNFFSNISIAYRILFIVPMMVSSTERWFSKLKLLKKTLGQQCHKRD